MKNIAIVTGPIRNCGIYIYGLSLYKILKKSKKYNFYFLEANSCQEVNTFIKKYSIQSVIYNWHPATISWCNNEFINSITNVNNFMIIGHELNNETFEFSNVKAFFHINPNFKDCNNIYSTCRPIKYYDDINYFLPSNNLLKIGTSGFGENRKNLDKIVNLLNNEFKNENIEFNVHFSIGYFIDNSGTIAKNSVDCLKNLNKNIKININHNFLKDYELVKWLNNNDLNIYYYDNFNGSGVSASIDKAIASKKPFMVSNSNYFEHVIKDEINLEKTTIKKVIYNNKNIFNEFYEKWNEKNLIEQYEKILNIYDSEA